MKNKRVLPLICMIGSVAQADPTYSKFFIENFYKNEVIVDNYNNLVHSEGLGVGLIAAANIGDLDKFKNLSKSIESTKNEYGLYAWSSKLEGKKLNITDKNNATDGELYIAYGYLLGYEKFKNKEYLEKAKSIVNQIEAHLIKSSTHGLILTPAKFGFDEEIQIINLSYYVFPAMNKLKEISSNKGKWNSLIDNGLSIIRYSRFGKYQLPPDWLQLKDPVEPWSKENEKAYFGYDAIRIPMYLKKIGYSKEALSRFSDFLKLKKPTVELKSDKLASYTYSYAFQNVKNYIEAEKLINPNNKNYYDSALMVMLEAIN